MENFKVKICQDEWYPVFVITNNDYHERSTIDLSATELEFVLKSFKQFKECQALLGEKFDKVMGGDNSMFDALSYVDWL